MKKILVMGSLNMDLSIESSYLPRKGETAEGKGFFTSPGGKGGNQAAAAAKLGGNVHLIAKAGCDYFGDQLIASLENSGVSCAHVLRAESTPTGVAVILRIESDNRIICDYGANACITGEEIRPLMDQLAGKGDLFLTQFECPKESVFDSLRHAKESGMVTLFNPAPAREIPDAVYPLVDYFFVNETECAFLSGINPDSSENMDRAVAFFEEKGVSCPIITLGEKGSVYLEKGRVHLQESYAVPALDTTGAGDTFIGAFASRLAMGKTLDICANFATKAAALAVQKIGAQQSIPTEEEINHYFSAE